MSNMSYCRFENTSSDMADCLEVSKHGDEDGPFDFEALSEHEREGFLRLLRNAKEFAELHTDFGGF